MNKSELIAQIADKTGETKSAVGKVLEGFIDTVQGAVKSGQKVSITGFGTFELLKTAARTGRNPQTGAEVTIPEGQRPKFTAGKSFKDHVNS